MISKQSWHAACVLAHVNTHMPMQNDYFTFFRVFAAVLFAAILALGGYLLKHRERLFGVDPSMPSENASSRTYTKVLVVAIWAHLLAFTGAAALFLG